MKEIYLIGGGGHCKSCIDVIENTQEFKIKGIFDTKDKIGEKVLGYEIIGDDNNLKKFIGKKDVCFLITLGQIKSTELREKYFAMDLNFVSIISPNAYVSKHASIGVGTIVMHSAFINAGAKIGKNCIINTKSLIEHDCTIGDHCHISTATVVNGDCKVGDNTFIGSNSVLKNGITVSPKSILSFGVKHG